MDTLVGTSQLRKEDARLLTGRGRFVEDITPPGTTYLAVVRSGIAFGRVVSIDVTEAAALAGVLGVWTADDLAGLSATRSVPGMERPCLAGELVRFVGEPVAVVVATTPSRAADAAAAVKVAYEEFDPLVTIDQALTPGARPIVPGTESNAVIEVPLTETDARAEVAASPRRLDARLLNQRVAPVPVELIGCVADWSATGLTLWATVQSPHPVRIELAVMFGLPQNQVRVIAPDVGGAFGSKASFYPEYILAAELSRRLGRPVKYVQTRREGFVEMTHGRGQVQDVSVGFDEDGRLLALQVDIVQDCGAWPDPTGSGLPTLTIFMSGGCYKIPKIGGAFRSVVTNTTPVAAYRGAGRPEGSFLIERVMDLVARELGLDPAEVRRRNFIQPAEMPYATQFPLVVYDVSDYPQLLEMVLEAVDYDGIRRTQEARGSAPERLLGVGLSTFVEMAGFGPSAFFEAFGYVGGWESSTIRMSPDGSVTLSIGTSPHGQGHETAMSQVASDALGGLVAFEAIRVQHGDTQTVQEGMGTMGSRGMPVAAPSVAMASRRLLERLKEVAAHLLEAAVEDVVVQPGHFGVAGVVGSTVPLAQVAISSYQPHKLPPESTLGLEFTSYHEPVNLSFPSGAHACVVEVDVITGEVEIVRYVAVDDCGVVINPLLARGQLHGGVVQGIAQALMEEVVYADDGQPLTGDLGSYMVPTAPDMPDIEAMHLEIASTFNELGAKGLGESGATAAPQAVVNAVLDALAPLGITKLDMPMTAERVWRTITHAQEER